MADETPVPGSPHPMPAGGGEPEHLRLMLDRFRQGCEVCGVMDWRATKSGEMACGCCGNVFDVPVIEEPSRG